jgi:acyl transferase domain-containing protein
LSAKNPAALGALAERLTARLRKSEPASIPSICHSMRSGRAAQLVRVAVTGSTAAELAEELTAAVEELSPNAVRPRRAPTSVTLLVGRDQRPVESALNALAEAFPGLAGTAVGAPADQLAALLGGLGLRTTVEEQAHIAADPVQLSWRSGDAVRTVALVGDAPEAAPALLLDALAALFVAGAELRLDGLRGPGAVLLGDLPTYPFQRRRFWIDEPVVGAAARERRSAATAVSAAVTKAPSPTDTAAVEGFLLGELREVLQADEPLDPERSLLDSGGDSFISTLFITRVEAHYRFRLMSEELPLDLPLGELLGLLARDITDTATADPAGEDG